MPLYLRKSGHEAEKEKQRAIEREMELAQRRATVNVEEKRIALREMSNLNQIRKGVQNPPFNLGEGYTEPTYDSLERCWKTYPIVGNVPDYLKWKGWSVNTKSWLDKDAYNQTHQGDLSSARDENTDPASGTPMPTPGIKRQSTIDSIKSLTRAFTGKLLGFGSHPKGSAA